LKIGEKILNKSPWGIASGAEWFSDYPKFYPLLKNAGCNWFRYFPEWNTIQPEKGKWDWKIADEFVLYSQKNDMNLVGVWAYFAKWASLDGGTRRGPIKDILYWRDYISATVKRYGNYIKYWEVWNEFNGSFYESDNKVKDYVELVENAYEEAKRIDPSIKIGLSVASCDIGFLDLVIKNGASGHFDFIAVHPYENLAAMMNGDEEGFLQIARKLRKMLEDNKQRKDIQLFITEIGYQTSIEKDLVQDSKQAEAIVKAFLLSIIQGFDRIFWFEARGPAYGHDTDHGIIRRDWSLRPSYEALKQMTTLLGNDPEYLGFYNMAPELFAFLFNGANHQKIMVLWTECGKKLDCIFTANVKITKVNSETETVSIGEKVILTESPVFIQQIPEHIIRNVRIDRDNYFLSEVLRTKKGFFTWHFSREKINVIRQIFLRDEHKNFVKSCLFDGEFCTHITDKDRDNICIYFRIDIDSDFLSHDEGILRLTLVIKNGMSSEQQSIALTYETINGYEGFRTGYLAQRLLSESKWHEYSWELREAYFANRWGWNFALISLANSTDFFIREIKLEKI